MGHGRQKSNEARTGAMCEACKAQPFPHAVLDADTVLERPHEPPGERLRRRRRIHLHGDMPAKTQSKSLRPSPQLL